MRLSQLTISGFKSFARTTTFEFPAPTSAIVGPNGSGKSNVAEAIRWVLGEQSIKILRGKKGEDLIFNGSPSSPRMGKAAVALTFDNRDHALPLDFNEIKIERKIFRDGANEYYLNDSQVRLKDIIELIARMGLGETKHNIIGQGEVDHTLAAPARERREILEETIGLRLYQLRKREAERKLAETSNNMREVESLVKEIRPHLKFLKIQADRAEKRETVIHELREKLRIYVAGEKKAIAEEAKSIKAENDPASERLKAVEKEIREVNGKIESAEIKKDSSPTLKLKEMELEDLENKRRALERELGRIEGRLEAGRASRPTSPPGESQHVETSLVQAKIKPLSQLITATANLSDIGEIKRRLKQAEEMIESFLAELESKGAANPKKEGGRGGTESGKGSLEKELGDIERELAAARAAMSHEMQNLHEMQSNLGAYWQKLRGLEEEAGMLRSSVQRLDFRTEKLAFRKENIERMIRESGMADEEFRAEPSLISADNPEELRHKIEKLKARVEEIGGIDPAVLKEYLDTKARYEFLERELNDLDRAKSDLGKLIADLEERIESDFKKGFAKIREEFQNYFRIIFGGGKGDMTYAPLRKVPSTDETGDTAEEAEPEYGIEIDVSLPRKKIKGLAMLSGGERALVSIALLFAISAVNPPPFLVLDETDAALDEANSRKYADLLKELSKKTQLILITHNRETMQQAGVLYGVTMGEDGISKVLSLKLEEVESYGNR